ncbi:septum formation inhibitor Maf [Skermania sp. ID1734]|uniref:nucleoside triphosphate pyrophosphatase n=1 Tax=Skermania sp. ID1734 TaxID=2597516 RepID=UPI00117F356E|nr:nucleoside triphosphate pyrophosphatase [Skermania sp. ID1734]TSD97415.1 septum formation inhibitor Maf [Skermania sp. ID1734]
MTRLVLASASPARRAVLQSAGITPLVRVSHVDEDAVAAALPTDSAPETVVIELARAKARTVASELTADTERVCLLNGDGGEQDDFLGAAGLDCVIVGCDSMLLIDGVLHGKPGSTDVARARWQAMAGRSGDLLTGHCVIRVDDGRIAATATGCSTTTVHFAEPRDADLDAYLATGEPLQVAGAFTLDGLGGWFVDRIEGDPSSVIGIGLPLLRRLLDDVGLGVHQLWRAG